MVKTRMQRTAIAARNAGRDLELQLAAGGVPQTSTLRFAAAAEQFLAAVEHGRALNKYGRRYTDDAAADLRGSLNVHVVPVFGTRLFAELRRGDIQKLVDDLIVKAPLTPQGRNREGVTLSGSRIRSIVYAIGSLYAWGRDRDLLPPESPNPTDNVRLPAVDARPRVTVARSPHEVQQMLLALNVSRQRRAKPEPVISPGERLPFALAIFAGARRAEIRRVEIRDVDFDGKWIFLGVDSRGRKSEASLRGVPLLPRLERIILMTLLETGRRNAHPESLLCPGDRVRGRNSGMLSFEALQTRADDAWEAAKLERDTPHRFRHYFASWLDAAGVRHVVQSALMGHRTHLTRSHDMGALVTQRVYTHALANDLVRGMQLLDSFIDENLKQAVSA